MKRLLAFSLLLSSAAFVPAAHATSVSATAVQVNTVPAGTYNLRGSDMADGGAGKFMIFWAEDKVSDFPNVLGNVIRSRGFQVAGAGFSNLKPDTIASSTAVNGSYQMAGVQTTTNGDMHLMWAVTNSGSGGPITNIYKQVFRAGNKVGGIGTFVANINGQFVRYVGGRTDKAGALLWKVSTSLTANVGKMLAATGSLASNINFSLPSDTTLLRTEGFGTGFVATTNKHDATYTNYQIIGRSFSTAFVINPALTTLQPTINVNKLAYTNIGTRDDRRVVFFDGLVNAQNKVDTFAQAYRQTWAVWGAKVKVESGLSINTYVPPLSTALTGGELLIGHTIPDGAGYSIVFRRLNASLGQVGPSAKIGPFPSIGLSNLFTLSTGKVVATYTVGTKLYIRQVTP